MCSWWPIRLVLRAVKSKTPIFYIYDVKYALYVRTTRPFVPPPHDKRQICTQMCVLSQISQNKQATGFTKCIFYVKNVKSGCFRLHSSKNEPNRPSGAHLRPPDGHPPLSWILPFFHVFHAIRYPALWIRKCALDGRFGSFFELWSVKHPYFTFGRKTCTL